MATRHDKAVLDAQLALTSPDYGTMTHQNGNNILWYPDRKFFLLGKDVE